MSSYCFQASKALRFHSELWLVYLSIWTYTNNGENIIFPLETFRSAFNRKVREKMVKQANIKFVVFFPCFWSRNFYSGGEISTRRWRFLRRSLERFDILASLARQTVIKYESFMEICDINHWQSSGTSSEASLACIMSWRPRVAKTSIRNHFSPSVKADNILATQA